MSVRELSKKSLLTYVAERLLGGKLISLVTLESADRDGQLEIIECFKSLHMLRNTGHKLWISLRISITVCAVLSVAPQCTLQ